MKALVGAFKQEKALVGAFSVIVQPVVEPMDRFTALVIRIRDTHQHGTEMAKTSLRTSQGSFSTAALGSSGSLLNPDLDLGALTHSDRRLLMSPA